MNQSSNELVALGRVIRAIKRFRQTVPDSKTASRAFKDDFLKQHLSEQDWLIWQQLQTDSPEMLPNHQSSVPDQTLPRQHSNRMLN